MPPVNASLSQLSTNVSTTHEDTISRVKFTFAQNLLIGGQAKYLGEALKKRLKSGLTLRIVHYSAEVKRTFMLTYVLFMIDKMSFLTVCRWVRNSVQTYCLLQVLRNLADIKLQVVQRLFKNKIKKKK